VTEHWEVTTLLELVDVVDEHGGDCPSGPATDQVTAPVGVISPLPTKVAVNTALAPADLSAEPSATTIVGVAVATFAVLSVPDAGLYS
jgi:hypothetical protein